MAKLSFHLRISLASKLWPEDKAGDIFDHVFCSENPLVCFFIVNSDIFLIHARQGLISSLYIQANFVQFRVTCQSLRKNCALSCFYDFDDMYALTNPCWTASFLLIWYKIARIINFPSGKVFARKRPMLSTALRCSLWILF